MTVEDRACGIGDLAPNTHEWHAANVGMLIGNLQSIEFVARIISRS